MISQCQNFEIHVASTSTKNQGKSGVVFSIPMTSQIVNLKVVEGVLGLVGHCRDHSRACDLSIKNAILQDTKDTDLLAVACANA